MLFSSVFFAISFLDEDIHSGFTHDDERRMRSHYGVASTGLLQTITDSLEDEDDEEERHRRGDIAHHPSDIGHHHARHTAMRIVEKPQLISPDLDSRFMMGAGDRLATFINYLTQRGEGGDLPWLYAGA